MDISALLKELETQEIGIALDGSDLQLNFGTANIDPQLIAKIKLHKGALIQFLQKYAAPQKLESIPLIAEAEDYPISDAQQRMWVASQFQQGSLAYHLPNVFPLPGHVNLEAFNGALRAVVERHEILRTVFLENENGEIRQRIIPFTAFDFSIQHQDFSATENPNLAAEDFVKIDNAIAFDLAEGPLLRAFLLQLGPKQFIFYYNLHHIISDGWSQGILANEVLAYYEGMLSNQPTALPVLNLQYKDYASWQRQRLANNKLEQGQYLLNKFAGEISPINLPSSKQRPAIKTHTGAALNTYIDAEQTAQLKAFSQQEGASLFISLQAIWSVLMQRYTLQTDIILGTPVAGRDHPDLANQIGCYINTLVFRNQVHADQSFSDFYAQVKEDSLQTFAQQFPFERLVTELKIERDISRSVLFDILLVFQNANTADELSQVDPAQIHQIERTDGSFAKMDLEIIFREQGDCLSFNILYNRDVYEASMLEQLMSHFKILLANILKAPTNSIGDFKYLTQEEENQIESFNHTAKSYPKDQTILNAYQEQLAKRGEAIAIHFQDEKLSFSKLEEQSNALANYLLDQYKIEHEDLVGLQLERGPWMSIAILAILKIGAAYVPIDTTYPEERTAFIKKDASLKVCIDKKEVEKFKTVQEKYTTTETLKKLSVNQLAYAIYTSGSTGKPKGVLNQHDGLYNRLCWMRDDLNIESTDVFLQKTPYTFDVSVWELLLPLLCGSKLVYAKKGGHKDPLYLQHLIEAEAVSIIHFVPSMLEAFLVDINPHKCRSLKRIVCSGEALPEKLVLLCREFLPQVKLYNLYGPTEAAIDVSAIDLTQVDVTNSGVSIGHPVANTQLYIVNENLQKQAIGVPGELLIGGVQVARGYLNLPELTAAKFINSPFQSNERLYKTGDLAAWRTDGSIDFLGRLDNQVKIRGNRIELGEVEQCLQLADGVANCAVLVKKNAAGREQLVAYVKPNDQYEEEKVFAFLKHKLPEYMIPSLVIPLAEMPLTVSGKINRKVLPDPHLTSTRAIVLPQTESETVLLEIWKNVLELEELSTTANFFRIGGDSIIAIRLLSQLNKKMEQSIKIEALYAHATIAELAKYMEQMESTSAAQSAERDAVLDEFAALRTEVLRN